MPSPSYDLLVRMGLIDPVPDKTGQQIKFPKTNPNDDRPEWKRNSDQAIDMLVEALRGTIGLEPYDEQSLGGKANIGAQLVQAGLPFATLFKGKNVFHGTRALFDKFDSAKNDVSDILGRMFHFTPEPRYADDWASGAMKSGSQAGRARIIPAKVEAKNILDLYGDINIDDLAQAIAALPPSLKDEYIQAFKNIRREHGLKTAQRRMRDSLLRDYNSPHVAKKSPFDAVLYKDAEHQALAVPETTPIRSPYTKELLNEPGTPIEVKRLPDDAVIGELEHHPGGIWPKSRLDPTKEWEVFGSDGKPIAKFKTSEEANQYAELHNLDYAPVGEGYVYGGPADKTLAGKASTDPAGQPYGFDIQKSYDDLPPAKFTYAEPGPQPNILSESLGESVEYHPKYGFLTKNEALERLDAGEISTSWFDEKFPDYTLNDYLEDPDTAFTPAPEDVVGEPTFIQDLGGSHGAQLLDIGGEKYVYKPGEGAISIAEEYGTELGQKFNPWIPLAKRTTHPSYPGTIQRYASDTSPLNPNTLSVKDMNNLSQNQVIDWLIGNHDAHIGQFARESGGNIIPFDKGQAWKYWGSETLSPTYHPNAMYGEKPPIYHSLVGKVDPNTPTYFAEELSHSGSEIMDLYERFAREQFGLASKPYDLFMKLQEKKLENLPDDIYKYWKGK